MSDREGTEPGLRFSEIGRLRGKSEAVTRTAWRRAARGLHEPMET